MASGPPKITFKAPGIKVCLEKCILANNRVSIRMSTITFQCLTDWVEICSTNDQALVVRNSLFLGGGETRGAGEAIRFAIHRPTQKQSREPQIFHYVVIKPDQQLYLSSDPGGGGLEYKKVGVLVVSLRDVNFRF